MGGHLRLIIRFTDISVHAGLSRVAGQCREVSQVEHMRSERVG